MNITVKKVLFTIIAICLSSGLLGGCAVAVSNISSGHAPEAEAAVVHAHMINAVFSTAGLPRHFLLVAGNTVHDFNQTDSDLVSLDTIIPDEPATPQSFWLISPFYQAREYFFNEFDLADPIDLAALAARIPANKIAARQISPLITEAGPFVSAQPHSLDPLYYWSLKSDCVILPSTTRHTGFIGADPNNPINPGLITFLNPESIAFSPQAEQIAFIDRGYLLIMDRSGNRKGKWPLTSNPGEQNHNSFSTDFISWSPNGRYIVGSNHSFAAHYLQKLWVLDLNTGKIAAFNARTLNQYTDPVWSPDGNQLIVSEYIDQSAEMVHSQWTLLDIRSRKLIFVTDKYKDNLDYDFSWDKNSKLSFTLKPSSRVDVYDRVANDPLRGAQLRILSADGQKSYLIDLLPSLPTGGGLQASEIQSISVYPLVIDGSSLYLRVQISTTDNKRNCTCYGKIDLDLGTAVFLPPVWSERAETIPLADNLTVCGRQVLDITGQNTIHVIDLDHLTMITATLNEKLLYACWYQGQILCITENDISVYRLTPEGLSIAATLFKTTNPEKFSSEIKASPDGRYLAVPRKKPLVPMIDIVNLVIIDLQSSTQ